MRLWLCPAPPHATIHSAHRMSNGDVDISWQALRRIVQDWGGTAAELSEFVPLHGGQINTTLGLHLKDGQRVVAKISPHRVDRSYEREAYQLTLLKSLGLPVPQVYQWKIGSLDDPVSYLLIEHIDGMNLAEARKHATAEEYDALQHELAELVAAMHSTASDKYMRVMDGGETFDNWCKFYRSVYDPIWHEAEKDANLPKTCRKQIAKLHERLERFLVHGDKPRLVHWDIWSTNVMVKRDDASGKWKIAALLDPNCKYAHAEAEIAYMELFHTVTPAFMKQYQQHHKLSGDYHRFRKPIYQLYPLINHVNLFGREYLKLLVPAVERTASLV
jgi:fructosamine-3-kinase